MDYKDENIWLMKGDTVLDFTIGSGTTGVACRNLNRKFIGIELGNFTLTCNCRSAIVYLTQAEIVHLPSLFKSGSNATTKG